MHGVAEMSVKIGERRKTRSKILWKGTTIGLESVVYPVFVVS
jgi:hypothetical protein